MKAEWTEYHKMRKSNQKEIYFFQADVDTIDIDGNDFRIAEPYAIILIAKQVQAEAIGIKSTVSAS